MPTDVFNAISEASPTRVVSNALGRFEVYSPIPPPDGATPTGSHTHLNVGHLQAGIDWPAVFDIPAGWTSGTAHYLSS